MDPFILTLTQDGLDDVLAPWSASQGDVLMDSDDDEALLAVARRADQQGRNPLFSVRREGVREPRSWQNGTAVKDRVQLRLEQNRKADEDFLAWRAASLSDRTMGENLSPI